MTDGTKEPVWVPVPHTMESAFLLDQSYIFLTIDAASGLLDCMSVKNVDSSHRLPALTPTDFALWADVVWPIKVEAIAFIPSPTCCLTSNARTSAEFI